MQDPFGGPLARTHNSSDSDDELKPPDSKVRLAAGDSLGRPSQHVRNASTQSIAPSFGEDEDRRILLVIYIHGFMGNETSFQFFPAHVHNALKRSLADTHVIHSKIYPRYKTYKAIDVARDNFSKWLEPHEAPTTDVILVGHSMGGLLAAEVALMPASNPVYGHPYQHRILGTISIDAPLLGLHPGIIVSGISSLFRKAPEQPGGKASQVTSPATPAFESSQGDSMSTAISHLDLASMTIESQSMMTPPGSESTAYVSPTLSTLSPTSSSASTNARLDDPTYNPAFTNDVRYTDRGFWRNLAHFANKHRQDGLVNSAYEHILSHLEFNSSLTDYPGLHRRYDKLRKLEDTEDGRVDSSRPGGVRIRFVNYYTVSTGYPKATLTQIVEGPVEAQMLSQSSLEQTSPEAMSTVATPRISIEDCSNDSRHEETMRMVDPVAEEDASHHDPGEAPEMVDSGPKEFTASESNHPDLMLPSIPSPPTAPVLPDLSLIQDKALRKQAEKEAARTQKTYNQAIKNHEKAIKERSKLVDKQRKQAEKARKEEENEAQSTDRAAETTKSSQQAASSAVKERKKQVKEEQKARDKEAKEAKKAKEREEKRRAKEEKDKMPKQLKFIMLPSKTNGVRDSAWVPVYMKDMDEVAAHCGLFFESGEQYEALVADVASRITGWVRADLGR